MVSAVLPMRTCEVSPARSVAAPGGGWSGPRWRGVPSLTIDNAMGEPPVHRPRTQVKIAYDETALRVIFRVEDRYVRSRVTSYQGPVCTDSCVELFFTPGPDVAGGYFNIEANCGGALLFMHQKARGVECVPLSEADGVALALTHTLPAVVEPEIAEPTEWLIEYRVPYAVLSGYARVTTPAPGVRWRANLYKCADQSSHPHWLTWSPVDWPRPDFHRPEFFGTLAFSS